METTFIKEKYFKSIVMMERLHRIFLDIIRHELERLDINDINNVQCLVLYNMGTEKIKVGDISNRGYYLGTNISYNLRNMIKNGYIVQEEDKRDRRCMYVKLSDKGIKLYNTLSGNIFDRHSKKLLKYGIKEKKLSSLLKIGNELEKFWLKW